MTANDRQTSEAKRVVSPDLLVSHLAGEAILLDLRSKLYFRLNETAAFIWQGLERGDSSDAIVSGLVSQFDVTDSDARAALDRQIAEFDERGFFK